MLRRSTAAQIGRGSIYFQIAKLTTKPFILVAWQQAGGYDTSLPRSGDSWTNGG